MMWLIWLYGLIGICAGALIGNWAGVAWRNRTPFRWDNVVLITAVGVAGVALFLVWTTGVRLFDAFVLDVAIPSTRPALFRTGLAGLALSLTALVWAGSLRRKDFMRLDGPSTISRGWFVFSCTATVWTLIAAFATPIQRMLA